MEFGILSLLPPVLAIVLALVTRNVIPALFAGVWLGATMVHDWNTISVLLYLLNKAWGGKEYLRNMKHPHNLKIS